jgi:hypothetical protein
MGDDSEPVGASTAVLRSGQTPQGTLELAHVSEALGKRRRYRCYTLLPSNEWSLTDLAVKTAASENDCPGSGVTDSQCDRVCLSPTLTFRNWQMTTCCSSTRPTKPTGSVEEDQPPIESDPALGRVGATVGTTQEEHARRGTDEANT